MSNSPRTSPRSRALCTAAAAGLVVSLAFAAPGFAAGVERPLEREFAAAAIQRVELENLAGVVTLTAAAGGSLRVRATVFAEDSADESAQKLVDSLRVEFDEGGGTLRVRAVYPVAEHTRYHYPRQEGDDPGSDWSLGWPDASTSMLKYQGARVRVSGSRAGGAATLYADFALEVPAGVAVVAKNAVGSISSSGVAADQTLDSSSGPIRVAGGKGALVLDTGSGEIAVERHDGDVLADTGSGNVSLRNVSGTRLAIDTGSGDIDLESCRGSVAADTGSGDVVARGLVAGRSFHADTGSGDVRAEGDFGAVLDLVIDTGSGDVTLTLATAPSLRLAVSTGSGEVDLDLDGVKLRRLSGHDLVAELGSGEGEGSIDTGSGDVLLRAAN